MIRNKNIFTALVLLLATCTIGAMNQEERINKVEQKLDSLRKEAQELTNKANEILHKIHEQNPQAAGGQMTAPESHQPVMQADVPGHY